MQVEDITDPGAESVAPRAFRRQVFYIPGYDPIHARRYRELYRKEAAAQSETSGYWIDLKPKNTNGAYGWRVEAEIEGARVEADVEVLDWTDLVRASMGIGILATHMQLLRTYWTYIVSGVLVRLMRLRTGPAIAAFYPLGMLLGQLLVVLSVATALGVLLAQWTHWIFGALLAAAILPLGLRWFRSIDHHLYAYYLTHFYSYSSQCLGANPPELETRMAEFGARIRAALSEDHDEVLVVGHSSGAQLAVSVLADLVRDGLPDDRPALGLLSLGHVIPMVSFLPKAGRLRADLAYLSVSEALTWVDVTAPGDVLTYALCDPVAVTGLASPGKRWPLVISAAFTQSLSPERSKALRRRYYTLHFQYLCAFDRPGDYDYFRITAGPQTLAARFAGRAPSNSRIETPLSPYCSLACSDKSTLALAPGPGVAPMSVRANLLASIGLDGGVSHPLLWQRRGCFNGHLPAPAIPHYIPPRSPRPDRPYPMRMFPC